MHELLLLLVFSATWAVTLPGTVLLQWKWLVPLYAFWLVPAGGVPLVWGLCIAGASLLVYGLLPSGARRRAHRNVSEALQVFTIRRKLYRYCALIFPLVVYPILGTGTTRWVMAGIAAGVVAVDLLRTRVPPLRHRLARTFAAIAKQEEGRGLSRTSLFLAALGIVALFPGRYPGPAAMVILVLGDAWAVLAGSRLSTPAIGRGKSLGGTVAAFCAGWMGAYAALGTLYAPLTP
ncbi:MAG: hypothetical protein K9L28_05675, partial [Synergistales bacterium]|nr:hypothetical protein [Synergistales bacterium]